MAAHPAPRLGERMGGFARSLAASLLLHGVVIGAGLAWLLPRELGSASRTWNASFSAEAPEEELLARAEPEGLLPAEAEEPTEPTERVTPVEELPALAPEPRPDPIPDGAWRVQRLTRSSASLRIEPPAVTSVASLEESPERVEEIDLTPAASEVAATASTGAMLLYDPPPEYPRVSVRIGEEGSVLLELLVACDGCVTSAVVLESSGHRRLDEAALTVVATWRFEPATRAGVAVEARYPHRVTFRLAQTR